MKQKVDSLFFENPNVFRMNNHGRPLSNYKTPTRISKRDLAGTTDLQDVKR